MTPRPGMRLLTAWLLLLLTTPLVAATTPGARRGQQSEPTGDLVLTSDLQGRLETVLERCLPATVRVVLRDASGSGVVVSPDGLILTAAHVAKRAGESATIYFDDGTTAQATTLGGNTSRDTALLQIEDALALTYVEIPPPGPLPAGGWCVALGFPRGGVEGQPAVARLGRLNDVDGRFLLTDCALISGDSGGPLFDLDGELIGIHSRIELDVATNYHVPMRSFRLGWERLLGGERWSFSGALLGLREVGTAADGARASELLAGGPAERGGLLKGDVIRGLNGEQVYGADELRRLLMDLLPMQTISLSVRRGDEPLELEVTLGDRGASPPPDVSEDGAKRGAPALLGRDSMLVRDAFGGLARPLADSVATVVVDGRARALATVVDADGWLISKASEVGEDPVCVLSDGRALAALVVARDPYYDLALLRVEAQGLSPIHWERDPVAVGRIVLAAGARAEVLGIGVVGVAPRAIAGGSGKLGVVLAFDVEDAVVAIVNPDTPADLEGILAGDRLVRIGSVEVASRAHARELLGGYEAGESVRLELAREGRRVQMAPVLAARSGGVDVSRGRMRRERLEGDRSDLRGGFPSAMQHDVVLAPDMCGGPLIDLRGRAVGLNIARAGRVASYAVPSAKLDVLVSKLRHRALELVSDER